jgi:hypothetical protein
MVLKIVIIEVIVILLIVTLVIILMKRRIRKDKELDDKFDKSLENICRYNKEITDINMKIFNIHLKTKNWNEVNKIVNKCIDDNKKIKEALTEIEKDKLKYKL